MDRGHGRGVLPLDAVFLDGLHPLSGKKALDRVLNHPDPPRLVKSMSSEDFLWLVKKVGADESLQLLEMASLDQWQYILDVESWQKDRLDLDRTDQWIWRLAMADPRRLVEWFYSDGQALAYYYLYRSIVVEVKEDDGVFDFGPEFFTLDGFFYIRAMRENQRGTIEKILRTMADQDLLKYQALLTGLAGVLPAESEEDMYRMRGIRLAEHGFLPRDEAMAVYAPLKPERLKTDGQSTSGGPVFHVEDSGFAPRWPLQYIQGQNLLTRTVSNISDAKLLDRIRLEFTGLCNQIVSAEGLVDRDVEDLQEIRLQAAGYLNLILKERCHEDMGTAEKLLRMNTLVSLFRAGFGLALDLKWKADRWLKTCWFHETGLETFFWGREWGGMLKGLLKSRPLFYCGDESESGYRHFQSLSDLSTAAETLLHLECLDGLMASLTKQHPLDSPDSGPFDLTFYPLLFTLWARQLLDLPPGFDAISLEQARAFFSLLRAGDTAPPYRMFGFEERFLKAFDAPASGPASGSSKSLEDALSLVWRDFSNEMEMVPTDAVNAKYSKYILITVG